MRPGFDVVRTARIVRRVVDETGLDLRGLDVLTEAATGPFAATAAMAAFAGADEVVALARDSSFGSAEDAFAATTRLAQELGATKPLRFITSLSEEVVNAATIITNCRHLRPLDRAVVESMNPQAVVSLMYEGWEHRPGDVDRTACEERHIPLVGTNEMDPRVGVFDYLGPAATKLLTDAGFEILRTRVLLVCDNPFRPFLRDHLSRCGAAVETVETLNDELPGGAIDVVLVAAKPGVKVTIGPTEARRLAIAYPGTCVAQFWGDLDRAALLSLGISVWPLDSPGAGRMGILLSDLGPEPAVRLQAGGLKVGEILARARQLDHSHDGYVNAIRAAIDSGFGSPLDGQEELLK